VTELLNYVLETLREGSEQILYRGRRPDAADPILVLTSAGEQTSANLRRLEHEYSIARELDPSWAVRPRALVRQNGNTALLLDDPGGDLLTKTLGRPLELTRFLQIAISLAAALRQMHQQGIIHKHINPENVLIDRSGKALVTGFGQASRLLRERQPASPPDLLAGSFAYMAPEQTGRMNRSIDHRSDLYSLGVTLYEMLTGTLPFTASDPIGWVHCHVARPPVPPSERVGGIPDPLAAIVLKLLAKNAEDRYQTAAGAEADLRRCLMEWLAHGRIDPFALGTHDRSDRLLVPEKLYGREAEIGTLTAAFDRVVAEGRAEFVLVSGYAGIGKSSIVNELQKVLVRGYFASGKFDQYKRNIPYATLAQAFQSLVRQLLCKTDAELDGWRSAFQEALGPNGQLMVNLIPELALIIGEQPPVPEVAPLDAQNRFQLVFRRFLGVVATRDHPLVLFLDDLQWLDLATLELLEGLVTDPQMQHLLLVGAYRDNEVDTSHPLMRMLAVVRNAQANLYEVVLGPLRLDDVEQLVADSLRMQRDRVRPLARLVFEKTEGNPFFTIQFVGALAEERLLTFDPESATWQWDLGGLQSKGITDNVIDLMTRKLSRLPAATIDALGQFACLGNVASTATLSMVLGIDEQAVHNVLWDPVNAGLLVRLDDDYAFQHDRVQEAAYALIPEGKRTETHLRIGRALASRATPAEFEDRIFEIVNQLDRGASLIRSIEERDHVAGLNLLAGKRAKTSAAYVSALNYFAAGRALLAEDGWSRQYRTIFELELCRAECEFLTGDLSAAEQRLSMLSRRAADIVDFAAVTRWRVAVYTTLDRPDLAIESGLEYLRRIGVDWSRQPTESEVQQEFAQIRSQRGSRPIEVLIDLPPMRDPIWLGTMDVLAEMIPPALFTDTNLHCLVIARMANLSLAHGNCDASCHSYVWVGMLLGPRFGDYRSGLRYGQLACDLADQRGFRRFRARAYLGFAYILPWTRHIRDGLALMRRAYDAAQETSDLTFAAYSVGGLVTHHLASGEHLAEVQREAESALAFVRKAHFGVLVAVIDAQLGLIRTLRGLTPEFGVFDDGAFDERRFEQRIGSDPRLVYAGWRYWVRKLQARYHAGDYAAAVDAADKAQEHLSKSPSLLIYFEAAEFHFYAALARAALIDLVPQDERAIRLEDVVSHYERITIWAENSPENFGNRRALVGAEIARLQGRELDAERLYEEAIRSAREQGFIQNEALASELAGQFQAARGFQTMASAYLRNARSCYIRWGAEGKVRQLEAAYPQAKEPVISGGAETSFEQLDLATVVRVSQAVSSEIDFSRLTDTLMETALEHAGAERGLLIMRRGADLHIEAQARSLRDAVDVDVRQTPVTPEEIPQSVLRYVVRTQESLLLDDASAQPPFLEDEYVRRNRSRSILCLPLVKQANLIGVLYVENGQTTGAFTPARLSLLRLLASQAAIALENTRLYRDLAEREARIRRLVESDIIGIVIWDLDGRLIDANDAFLRMVQYDRDDLAAGLRWFDMTPPEWQEQHVAHEADEIKTTGAMQAREKEFFRKDGSRVPVLIGAAAFEGQPDQGVAYILDLTERKRAEEAVRESERRYREVEMELAHANRVATIGQLTGSIAHEVNQPIAATVTSAQAAMRWLDRDPPNIERVRQSLSQIAKDGTRAGEVVGRIRDLIKKAPPRHDLLEINGPIREVIELTRSEARKSGVSMRAELADGLPLVSGDRVRLQQVMVNLIVNAIEAMSDASDGARDLFIGSDLNGAGDVHVAVRDSGPGLGPAAHEHIFDAFYTTKAAGLGMGLSICRSIIEAHNGRLWVTANEPRGAIFQFTLPAERADQYS